MSEEPVLDMDADYQKFVMKIVTSGHELVPERRLYRHKTYKKDFPKGTPLKVDGVQYISPFGTAVTIDMLLPERADLALDSDGNVVSQQTFEHRYKEWLQWFSFPEGSEIDAEPISDVLDYVTQIPDTFGESKGFVTVGYDARKPAETVPTHKYDPNSDDFVEIKETQKMIAEALAQLARNSAQPQQQGKR